MGAFDKLLGKFKLKKQLGNYFKMLDGYSPSFTTYDGGVYEMELTRACIHTFATHCSKLMPTVTGSDRLGVQAMLDGKPNLFMTSAQFLYKVATLYEAHNTCFIVPVINDWDKLEGFYPVDPTTIELKEDHGEAYLLYRFGSGETAAIELSRVGVVSKYLYSNDLVGEDNGALAPTLQLLATQNQGIAEGIRQSATIRFMATIGNFIKETDLRRERKKWVEDNLGEDAGGLALFPNTYTNIQQIQSSAQLIDADQMRLIQDRVYTYFGTNESVLHNQTVGDAWAAYYEGKIEPFAIQLSQAMTVMTYPPAQRGRGHAIVWSANRLQYMTNQDKLQVGSQMFDRGVFSLNQVLDVWGLPHVDGGDQRYIRKEYTQISHLDGASAAQSKEETTIDPTE